MEKGQIEHVESKLIEFIDEVVDKKQRATSTEVEALPEVAHALAEIHKLMPVPYFSAEASS